MGKKTIAEMQAETQRLADLVRPYVPQVLARARDLLSDRGRWTDGTLARDGYGDPVQPTDGIAVQWCAVGAIEKCSEDLWLEIPDLHVAADNTVLRRALSTFAQQRLMDVLAEVAREITGNKVARPGEFFGFGIPGINDHASRGGYRAIIQALYMVTGVSQNVAEAVERYNAASAARRREAALKAWRKRRANALHAAAVEEAAVTPIVFGGTLPSAAVEERSEIRIG